MKIWYAVSGRGQGNVYTTCPVRNDHFKVWQGRIEGCISSTVCLMAANEDVELPSGMTWQDEPVEMTLTLGYGKE